MENTALLRALGEETLYMETIYLGLKIEKELKGELFEREQLLKDAEQLWKEVDTEYHSFLGFLQEKAHQYAAA